MDDVELGAERADPFADVARPGVVLVLDDEHANRGHSRPASMIR